MVGFLRKKKSDKILLGDETVLDRKGRVDGASLLDDNGDPTDGTLYNQNKLSLKKGGRRNSDEENQQPQAQPPNYPPQNYPYGQTYPPQNGYGYPQQQQPASAFGQPANGFGPRGGVTNNSRGSFGQQPQQQPQYPVQYGANQSQQQYPVQYGANPQQYGNQPQYGNQQQYPVQYGSQPQYPVQYGNYPPPPQQPQQAKKSFFRLPGYGKK